MPVKWGVFLTNIVGTVSQLLVLTYLLGEQLSGVSHAILSPNKPDVCPESATHLLYYCIIRCVLFDSQASCIACLEQSTARGGSPRILQSSLSSSLGIFAEPGIITQIGGLRDTVHRKPLPSEQHRPALAGT